MLAKLTISSNARSYNDASTSNNPLRRFFDWTREVRGLVVENPITYPGTLLSGASATIFDGIRTTTLNGTTEFAISLSPLDSGSRYRFSWTGGTNPTLRTNRSLDLETFSTSFMVHADQSVNLSSTAGSFSAVQVGDIVFVPNTSTGDSVSVFSNENSGYWVVLAVLTSANIQLTRLPGESFEGTTETRTVTDPVQIQAFSAAGVQVGDSVTVSAGFSIGARKTFTVDRVNPRWFEVLSSTPLPAEIDKLPTATGMIFYTSVKRFVRIEVDQDASLQYNGDTGSGVRVSPFQPGDVEGVGWDEKCGPSYKLVVTNQSAVPLNYVVFTAE